MPLHVETPLWNSRGLAPNADRELYLKMEALQPCGSFKLRGIGALCEAAQAKGARKLVASSGGNAGLAMAYAARELGLAATVVVPESTTEPTQARLRTEGAKVIVRGAVWDESHLHALDLVDARSAAYIHPFDGADIWRGHASMVEEMSRQGPRPDAILLSVGGGGLLCGVLEGLENVGWRDSTVFAIETEGAASFAATQAAGQLVEIDAIRSSAKSLGSRRVCEGAWERARRSDVRSLVVSDDAALRACQRFAREHRVLVELACGAALAPVIDEHSALEGFERIAVIVCGGADVEQLCS